MKLTTEELLFIDTYLQKSDVLYYDIRVELIDHIAVAVEDKMTNEGSTFYEAFKEYMATNKKYLINKREFSRTVNDFTLKFFKNIFFQPTTVLFVLAAYFIVQYIFSNWVISTISLLFVGNGILATVAIVHLTQYRKNKRFSGVETLSRGLTIVYNVLLFALFLLEAFIEEIGTQNLMLQFLAIMFFTTILIYVVAEYQLRRLYSKRYANESFA